MNLRTQTNLQTDLATKLPISLLDETLAQLERRRHVDLDNSTRKPTLFN